MKRTFYQLFILLTTIFLGGVEVYGQTYTCQGHRYGCQNSTYGGYYASINGLEILQDGNSVHKKAPDGCNDPSAPFNSNGHYNVMNNAPAYTLAAGLTYTVKFDLTNVANYNGYDHYFMAWLDLNGDGDYSDAGEHLSPSWGTYGTNSTHTVTFKVPCTGVVTGPTRIRFRTEYPYGLLRNNPGDHSNEAYMGETEEFLINIATDAFVDATILTPGTAYANVPYEMYYKYASPSTKIEWDIDNDPSKETWSRVGDIQDTTWTTPGLYWVKTRATNCLGTHVDSVQVAVQTVTKVPEIDFIADYTFGSPGIDVKITDLSKNGVSSWDWQVYDSFNNPVLALDLGDKISGKDWNPVFDMANKGLYTVCLEATNPLGTAKKCKSNYIKIGNTNMVTLGGGNQVSSSASGTLFDNGGSNAGYFGEATRKKNSVLISPCNAKKITLNVTEFEMNDLGDLLFVYDGTDETGTALHPLGGFNKDNMGTLPRAVVATSGSMFVYYVSNDAGYDDGFIANWRSELNAPVKPVASWKSEYPQVYATAITKFINTSSNLFGTPVINWEIEGMYYKGNEIEHQFSSVGTHEVCMIANTCSGVDTSCSNVSVIAPTSATLADFYANNTRPTLTDVVQMTATTDKANRYEWYILPEGNYSFENGTDKYSKNPQIKFKETGCYEIIFKAWNSSNRPLTTKTVQKIDYICVVDKCVPEVDFSSKSIGVNTVTMSSGNTNVLVSNTSAGIIPFQDFSSSNIASVRYGASYDLKLERADASDPWNATVWLDKNGDGTFTANEIILQKGPDTTNAISGTIVMPEYNKNYASEIAMRIGVGYKGIFVDPCGKTVGEFEDYGISLIRDNDIPEITILGGDTVVVEVGVFGSYSSNDIGGVGYTASDATEGDITYKVVRTTDLEENTLGVYFIDYNVQDASGNVAVTKTRLVKVVTDNTDPTIALNGASTVTIAVNDKRTCDSGSLSNEEYTELGATANDNKDGNLSSVVVIDGSVDVTKIGTYVLLYKVTDAAGNVASVSRTVNVVDTIAPIISFNGSDKIDIGLAWVDQSSICDNYDENVTIVRTSGPNGFPDPYKKGTYTVYYNAVDASGNAAKPLMRMYTVGDNKAPVVYINSSDTVIHDVKTTYNSIAATATDNYDDNKDISILAFSDVNEFVLGVYTEMFVAKDLAGNKDTAYRFVKVVDREKPTITGVDILTPVGGNFDNMWGIKLNDNYDERVDLEKNVRIVSSNVNIWVKGVYSMVYDVTDLSGNRSLRFHRKVIVDYDIESNVGINDVELGKQISVYPVPTTGVLNIEMDVKSSSDVKATVVNVLGKEVMDLGTITNGTTSFDLSNQPAGVYFVRFSTGSITTTKKVVLN